MSKRLDPTIKAARHKAYKARYFQKNKARIHKRIVEYGIKNPEKVKQQRMKYHLRHNRGIEMEEYNYLLTIQNKKCAICDYQEPEGAEAAHKLYIDHDHNLGKVRGLLCMRCNAAIGHFRESLTFMENAVEYMKKWNYGKLSDNTTNQSNSPA
jgi:hypothetical protein